ncbi:MAG: dihydropteroate synthase [Candidatus Marinimicrobia bacterium]|nr:dihydropteroate synthase [Candidatus Neomarinimicrobiota bacterium]|tara:strand:+ start:1073 stop:1915 length:843 start_codon:yes stop_codon:yes gene_type:complete
MTKVTLDGLLSEERTLVMGILNITPDSFSDGGDFLSPEAAADRALQMVREGVDILDIGGESSRPGAEPVSADEELDRLLPVIEELAPVLSIPISVDTYKSPVAKACLERGASIINDISALRFDHSMASVVTEFKSHVVLMHMKGTPRNMQEAPDYGDVTAEINTFFEERIEYAIASGINRERLILDPGIGFGKSPIHNFTVLRDLQHFADFAMPVLVGPSRKSFIGMTLDLPESERLEGTAASVTASVLNGAQIVRVHDVKEMKRVVTVADSIHRLGAIA